jgi:RNA polymerase sigma-70 factor (ECF subfamily)
VAEAGATAATTAVAMEVATTSAPHESQRARGRPGDGAAAARTELLYTEYGRTVSGLCQALLRNRAEAEDAAQQTFLSAHRALLNGSAPREPAAWLATIARNECWARIRTRMREPLPVEELETVATTNDPLAEAIRSADLAALWHAIEALPRQQRDALLLREFGGLTYEELASALSVTGSAVESLLFRARHRLRGKLRAVYASLSGASWLDALVRLLAGGAAAPVAAKVAALGVGAAALGSSAVVVPYVFDNHRPARGPLPAPAMVVHRSKAPPARAVRHVPALVTHVAPIAPVRVARHMARHDGSAVDAEHRTGGADGDHVSGSTAGSSPSPAPGDLLRVESIDGQSGDGSSGHDSSVPDGSSGDRGGGDGGGGSSGPDGGD